MQSNTTGVWLRRLFVLAKSFLKGMLYVDERSWLDCVESDRGQLDRSFHTGARRNLEPSSLRRQSSGSAAYLE